MNSKIIVVLNLCFVIATHVAVAQSKADKLMITGLVDRRLTVTIDSLRTMPAKTGGPIDIVSSSGQVRRKIQSFRGVLLRDLLDKAHVTMANQKDKGKYYIVAQATDGYTAVFAHNELFNNPTGNQVFILFEEDGKPITDDGAFVLLTANDTVTGARHVKWLNRIDIRKVD